MCVGLYSNIRALYNGVMIMGFLKLVFSLKLVYMICSNNSIISQVKGHFWLWVCLIFDKRMRILMKGDLLGTKGKMRRICL
jgi:hypothetical protein